MEKMGEGITAVATAMTQAPEETIENVGSTLQGRSQLKVRTEECLTGEGQLLMLDQFTDPALARTYLSIKSDELRLKFSKRQVERHCSGYFVDPIYNCFWRDRWKKSIDYFIHVLFLKGQVEGTIELHYESHLLLIR